MIEVIAGVEDGAELKKKSTPKEESETAPIAKKEREQGGPRNETPKTEPAAINVARHQLYARRKKRGPESDRRPNIQGGGFQFAKSHANKKIKGLARWQKELHRANSPPPS